MAAFPPQILVEVKSLLIAFHAVDGWITGSVRERERGGWEVSGKKKKRPSPSHTHMIQTHAHTLTHTSKAFTQTTYTVWHTCQPAETVIS